MNALNRFFDRREGLSVIYYDNLTNFVGAKRYLKFMNYFGQRNTKMQYQRQLPQKGVAFHSSSIAAFQRTVGIGRKVYETFNA